MRISYDGGRTFFESKDMNRRDELFFYWTVVNFLDERTRERINSRAKPMTIGYGRVYDMPSFTHVVLDELRGEIVVDLRPLLTFRESVPLRQDAYRVIEPDYNGATITV